MNEERAGDKMKVQMKNNINYLFFCQDEDGNRAAEMAIMKPECYVLKPQREGGGNNVYGEKVREVLQSMTDSQERTAWILMERIIPPVQKGYMIRPGGPEVPQLVDLVSELGIFGVIIG